MQIEERILQEIIPYEFNNRQHPEEQINRIANSIKEFGFNQPIVIDESNIILVGHGRFFASQRLGLKKVPTVKLKNLTEVQKKAYRVLDNKLQNDSRWDFNNVGLELGFLEDHDFDLNAWGLNELNEINIEPEVFDGSIADGITLEAIFKIKIPLDDSDSFERQLDEVLQKFPTAKKEKQI